MPRKRIGDINIKYRKVGTGDNLVFVHGLGSSHRDWEYQLDYFSNDYQILVFDSRGHGGSDKPSGPYSLTQFAQDTARLISSLDMVPAHVVGISMGGMIGLQLALDSPQVVKSLVVVNAGPDMTIRTLKDRLNLWQRLLLVRLFGMRKIGEILADRMFPESDQADLKGLFIERWAENDPHCWQESLKAIVGWSVSDRLGEIECPVLVISGDQDYTPVSTKKSYVRKLKYGELVVIKDSRHPTPVDQPETFNQTLSGFLQRVDDPTS